MNGRAPLSPICSVCTQGPAHTVLSRLIYFFVTRVLFFFICYVVFRVSSVGHGTEKYLTHHSRTHMRERENDSEAETSAVGAIVSTSTVQAVLLAQRLYGTHERSIPVNVPREMYPCRSGRPLLMGKFHVTPFFFGNLAVRSDIQKTELSLGFFVVFLFCFVISSSILSVDRCCSRCSRQQGRSIVSRAFIFQTHHVCISIVFHK